MAKFNQVGTQKKCTNCLGRIFLGKNENDVKRFGDASFFARKCSVKDRRCQAAIGPNDVSGNPTPPQYSTCQPSACTGSAPANQLENYGNCCTDGSLGRSCEFAKKNNKCFLSKFKTIRFGKEAQGGHPTGMRTVRTGSVAKTGLVFREVNGKRVKIPLNQRGNIFVRWCKERCDADAKCTMFQVASCLVDNTCKATDDAKCEFFGDAANAEGGAGQKYPKLSDDKLKALKKAGATWTCADGASVKDNHTGEAEFSKAGFKCPAGAQEVKSKTKCTKAMCEGEAARCCQKSTQTCFSKSAEVLKFQANPQ